MLSGSTIVAASFVFIKRACADSLLEAASEVFAKLKVDAGDDVSDLAARACAAFGWGTPSQARLYLIPHEGARKPSEEAEERAIPLDEPAQTLAEADVKSGSWLLARLPPSAFAAAASRAGDGAAMKARAGGGAAAAVRAASALSLSELAGPTFKHEARIALSDMFSSVCPWARSISRLLSRELDAGGSSREADIMGYVEGDSLAPCAAVPGLGAAVVPPLAGDTPAPALPPVPLLAATAFSPSDTHRMGPHKYFVAEAYSGARAATRSEKVQQLESLCGFLRGRWADQHAHDAPAPPADATAIIGAAALVLVAPSGSSRAHALRDAIGAVSADATGVQLARLRAAGRFFVVVLDQTQCPDTHFQRAVASELARLASVRGARLYAR